jgi:hypothetical protein
MAVAAVVPNPLRKVLRENPPVFPPVFPPVVSAFFICLLVEYQLLVIRGRIQVKAQPGVRNRTLDQSIGILFQEKIQSLRWGTAQPGEGCSGQQNGVPTATFMARLTHGLRMSGVKSQQSLEHISLKMRLVAKDNGPAA